MRGIPIVAVVLAVTAGLAGSAGGEEAKHGTKRAIGTVREAARTAGHAARDGVLTFGRSTRAFFTGGPAAAKRTWHENAARTKANAKTGARETKKAAD